MAVRVSQEERRLILAGYRVHRNNWGLVAAYVVENANHELGPIQQIYLERTPMQQRRRVRDVILRDIARYFIYFNKVH